MFEWHSALTDRLKAGGRDGVRGGRQLLLTEVRGWHLAQLAVFKDHHPEFQAELRACGAASLPVELYQGSGQSDSRLIRMTPHQYWWIAVGSAAMQRFARQLPASIGTVTMLSASRVRIRIRGPAARDLLAKGIALDLHPGAFQIGRSAQVGLHHSGAFLERVGEDSYEIFVQRTYAEWLFEWLIDAALPFGYDLNVEELGRQFNNNESL